MDWLIGLQYSDMLSPSKTEHEYHHCKAKGDYNETDPGGAPPYMSVSLKGAVEQMHLEGTPRDGQDSS